MCFGLHRTQVNLNPIQSFHHQCSEGGREQHPWDVADSYLTCKTADSSPGLSGQEGRGEMKGLPFTLPQARESTLMPACSALAPSCLLGWGE